MTTAAAKGADDRGGDNFEVNLLHRGVEPSDYKQAQHQSKHRMCDFVAELRMELYFQYIDRFCKGDEAIVLMHAGTKKI